MTRKQTLRPGFVIGIGASWQAPAIRIEARLPYLIALSGAGVRQGPITPGYGEKRADCGCLQVYRTDDNGFGEV